jgi:hypothetical protein
MVAANSGLPLPSTLSDAGSNRADYRMIDRLRRQGVCWRCACVYHFIGFLLELEVHPCSGLPSDTWGLSPYDNFFLQLGSHRHVFSVERAYRLLHTDDHVDGNPATRRGCSGGMHRTEMNFKV